MSQPSTDRRARRSGYRLIYSLLSSLVPGTGQVLAGRRRRGAVMISVSVLIIAGVVAAYVQGVNTLLSYAVQPRVLIGVFLLNLLVLAFRLGSVVDAYRSPQPVEEHEPAGWRGSLVVLALGAVLVVTAAPHAVLGYYTYLTYDTLNQVFSAEAITEELVEEMESPTLEPDSTQSPDRTPESGGEGAPAPAPSPTPAPAQSQR